MLWFRSAILQLQTWHSKLDPDNKDDDLFMIRMIEKEIAKKIRKQVVVRVRDKNKASISLYP